MFLSTYIHSSHLFLTYFISQWLNFFNYAHVFISYFNYLVMSLFLNLLKFIALSLKHVELIIHGVFCVITETGYYTRGLNIMKFWSTNRRHMLHLTECIRNVDTKEIPHAATKYTIVMLLYSNYLYTDVRIYIYIHIHTYTH